MILALVLAATALVACTSRPSAGEVVDQSTPVICAKSKECAGDTVFALAHPGGVDECVTKTKAEVKKQYGADLDKDSVCTDDELDKCLTNFKAAACPAGSSLPKLPCNC